MNIKTSILIASVYKQGVSITENEKQHDLIKGYLDMVSIPYQVIKGKYKGTFEQSFLFQDNETTRRIVSMIVSDYDQECYLYSDSNRLTDLVYPDGKTETLGQLVPITAKDAETFESWTYLPEIQQHYGIVKVGT